MKVAIVHDDLIQWGGAERMLLGLLEIFPYAPIFTSIFDKRNQILKQKFGTRKIITSFLQKIPGHISLYKALLPFYPVAFEQFDFSGFDLVISNTTRFAKSIITKPETVHICYCHTPPRFLWNLSRSVASSPCLLKPYLSLLKVYDQIASKRVDYYIAGSKNAQTRIKKIYGMSSQVIYPFIDMDRFRNVEKFDGGYFMVIARSAKYKRVDLAVKACLSLSLPLKVVGDFDEFRDIQGVDILRNLDDVMVVQLLAGCKALIIPGEEDFGLTSLEAQALGKPVIAYARGGVLETVIPDKTGILFNNQTQESLTEAIRRLGITKINPQDCIENASCFSKEHFLNKFKTFVRDLL